MGTRSIITVMGDDDQTLVNIYQQFDGYPSSVGLKLAKFLSGIKLVNGLPLGDTSGLANGMGCLAAQIVTLFKLGAGGCYIVSECGGEDFNYKVSRAGDSFRVEVSGGSDDSLFSGDTRQFLRYCISSKN